MTTNQPAQSVIPSSGYVRLFKLPELLGVSIATVNRWVKDGKLPAPTKLSGRVTAFHAGELTAWIASQPKR